MKHSAEVHLCLPTSRIPVFAARFGTKAFLSALLWIAAILGLGSQAYGSFQSSTTTLSVSPSSVAAGTPVTLTATVTGGYEPITTGLVMFCAAAAAHCDGAALLGVAQLTSSSTAAIKLTLGVGSYSIKATFTGIDGANGSTSAAHALTVMGAANYLSGTTLAATGSAGDYTLTSQVTFFGAPAATGTISFLDTSEGNALVGSAALDPVTLVDLFAPAPGSPLTADNAQFVVSGDFNNDGIPDLAVLASTNNGTVAIFLGKGDGTFQSSVDYGVGTYPFSMAVGDVNGDGKLDLIVANYSDNTVSVLLGNGDGTFQGQSSFGTGAGPLSVAVGDFNHDGRLDLAVTDSGGSEVSILLGNGDGTFQAEVLYPVPNPIGVAVGDFNHDGILDLAVTAVAQGAILDILLGVGDGTFQAEQFIQLPDNAYGRWPAVGDLRNNGTQDVLVPDLESGKVYVFLGNNDGTFQAPVTYAVAEASYGIALGDVNGDGFLDLVVPDTGGCGCGPSRMAGVFRGRDHVQGPDEGKCGCISLKTAAALPDRDRVQPGSPSGLVSVLLGNGDGTFAAKTDYTVGYGPSVAALADFNGDGLLDIATSDIQSNTATILLGEKTESAEASGLAVYGTGTHNVLASYAGDVDRAPSQSTTVPLTAVPQVGTSTTLAIAPNPAVFGQSVAFTATVSPAPTGSSLGTVSFYNGTTLLGSGDVNSSGVATFATTGLPVGSESIKAVYSGNEEFAASTSAAQLVTVKPAPTLITTSTALAASPNPATFGQSVAFTATVSPAPTGSSLGTVSFYDGTTLLGSADVNSSGVATFATTGLGVGSESIKAAYSGNEKFAASVSATQHVTVKPASTAITTSTALAASPNPATFGQSLTLTATVSPTPTGSPLGTVRFYDRATLLGSGSLNSSGVAALTISPLGIGSGSMTAVYQGNSGFTPSTSSAVSETVESIYAVTAPAVPVTVAQGGAALIKITVPPLGGPFNSVVTLSASGLPPGATATFTPPKVTPASAGAQTVMAIQLATLEAGIPARRHHGRFPAAPFTLACVLFGTVLGRKRLPRVLALIFVFASLGVTTSFLTGCNGGFASTPHTQAGNYAVKVTGTSGSFTASTTVTLVVQ